MKNINSLFLAANEGCSHILEADKVEEMNEILDSFDVEYTAANRTAGEVLPTIKLVSDDASIDITDQLSALSAQSRLIQKAKSQGDFGQGNMNMWYKVGVT